MTEVQEQAGQPDEVETIEPAQPMPLDVMPIGHGDPLRPLAARSREWLEKVAHAALVRIMGHENLQRLSPNANIAAAAVAVEGYPR